ncbi:MAG: hypothetical protein LC667_12995 [Thioalkalivibrio sp.]|nr:hypothetical protein [Thioalkalivibrio sp.]
MLHPTDAPLWLGNVQILADIGGEQFVDLAVARNRSCFARCTIYVEAVCAPFAEKLTSESFEMTKQVLDVSRRSQMVRLSDDLTTSDAFLSEKPIGLQNELNRFLQVLPRLLQGCTLRTGARQLLHEADVAFRHSLKDGGELEIHRSS